MAVAFTQLSWWLWSGKQKEPRISNSSSLSSSPDSGMWESDGLKFPSVKGASMASSSSRRVKRKWHSRQERKIDREYDLVLVPSEGGCFSGSESDDSNWSVGWLEPHGPGFRSYDDTDDSFAVLVPCYDVVSDDHFIPKHPRPSPTTSFPAPRTAMPKLEVRCTAQAQSAEPKPKEAKLWGGRFEESVTDAVERFTESISYDKALYKQDILGSKAHASMLAKQGLITIPDRDSIHQGLSEIERRIKNGEFEWRTDREDVHMNIEAALTDLIGEPAKKLHTARSRNDQVLTDFRLWCRDAIDAIGAKIKHLQVSLVKLAMENEGVIVPGYTHLQRAQPVLLQHLLLAFVEQLERDAGRLLDCRVRLNFCPLGACALAGTGLPIDRFMTSAALDFTAPMKNSIDAVSDRDFVLEFLSANAITAIHLSRLGEEWVLWASEEFGFLTPSDKVSTGSSIMPQKKNPDPMELVRGKSARIVGDLVTLLTLCKGLPLAYNRDLQEDKEPVFDSVKTILGMLEVSAEFAQNITFNRERIQKSLPAGHLDATTLADYLVKKAIPFRTSHDIVGRAVAVCVSNSCQLQDLSLDELRSIHPVFDKDVYEFLGVENSVKKFSSYGSTGSACVASQLGDWVTKLEITKGV